MKAGRGKEGERRESREAAEAEARRGLLCARESDDKATARL